MSTCQDTLNSIKSDVSSSVSILSNHQGYFDNISRLVGENNSSLSPTSPLQTNVEEVLGKVAFIISTLFTNPLTDPNPSLVNMLKDVRAKIYLDIIPNLEELLLLSRKRGIPILRSRHLRFTSSNLSSSR